MSETLVIDTPQGIEAYRPVTTLYGLRMEVRLTKVHGVPATALPTRGLALRNAQAVLKKYRGAAPRTRKACLKEMEALCKELGLTTHKEAA